MYLGDFRECIEKRFAYKRKYASKQDLLNDINNHMKEFMSPMTFPFHVGGYQFDAKYHIAKSDIAVSVVLRDHKSYGKDEVGYLLHQMEEAEKKGLIRGGVVIYNTDNKDEWKNDCIAIERPTIYLGKEYEVEENCVDWNEPVEGETVSRRYVIFMTAKARELDL